MRLTIRLNLTPPKSPFNANSITNRILQIVNSTGGKIKSINVRVTEDENETERVRPLDQL